MILFYYFILVPHVKATAYLNILKTYFCEQTLKYISLTYSSNILTGSYIQYLIISTTWIYCSKMMLVCLLTIARIAPKHCTYCT